MLHPAPAARLPRLSICALTLMLIAAAGVRSANGQTKEQDEPTLLLSAAPIERSSAADVPPQLDVHSSKPAPRGPIFATLETSYIGLQALDTASTLWALNHGFVEANPALRGVTAHPAVFIAVKAASAGGTIFLARRIAGRHRVAGIVLMAALDGAYAVVAGRNLALTATHTLR